jgi:ankyrin repeat protein
MTTFNNAVLRGVYDEIKPFLDAGADPRKPLKSGKAIKFPIEIAIWTSNARLLRLFIKHGASVNVRNKLGTPLLTMAVKMSSMEILRTLLDAGANPNAKGINGATPLMTALTEEYDDAARLLLRRDARPNSRDAFGMTPLHLATQRGSLPLVKSLVRHGARLNVRDRDRATPLHLAATGGYVDVAAYLLSKGADPNARDARGQTPMNVATTRVRRLFRAPDRSRPIALHPAFNTYDAVTLNHVPLNRAAVIRGEHRHNGHPAARHVYDRETLNQILNAAGQRPALAPRTRTQFSDDNVVFLKNALSDRNKRRYATAYKAATRRN